MKISIVAGNYAYSRDGIGRYTHNLIQNIKEYNADYDIQVADYGTTRTPVTANKKSILPSFAKKIVDPVMLELNYLNRFKKNNRLLVNRLLDINADIYHAVSPSECVAPVKLGKLPLVTTFHDIIPLKFRSRFLMEKFYFRYYADIAKRSDIIIADSHSTKEDIIEFLNVPTNKIKVIYPGIDTSKFHPVTKTESTIKKILYLGGLTRRKGIYEVVVAFAALLNDYNDIHLIIGGMGEENVKVKALIREQKIEDKVTVLGYVDEDTLPSVYQDADIFIYPSKYEGFGYTPLEAMASGIPVITSNISSLPEVVGDAAIKVNPENTEELTSAMSNLLNNQQLRQGLRTKGIDQASRFTWKSSIEQLVTLYKSLL